MAASLGFAKVAWKAYYLAMLMADLMVAQKETPTANCLAMN